VQDPTPFEHSWLVQKLGKFGAKRNLYFLHRSVQKTFSCHCFWCNW